MCFVPFPMLKSSGDQVSGECTVPGELCIHFPGPRHSFSWVCCESTVSGVPYVSSGELISDCDPHGSCQPSRISGRHG